MKRISVKEAQPGMVLARPINDRQGRIIVNQGASLTALYISRLGKWSVEELYIEEPQDTDPAPAPQTPPAAKKKTPAPPASPAPATASAREVQEAGPRMPPGIYSGPDLDERVVQTFSLAMDDPLMATLCTVVRKHLAEAGGGK